MKFTTKSAARAAGWTFAAAFAALALPARAAGEEDAHAGHGESAANAKPAAAHCDSGTSGSAALLTLKAKPMDCCKAKPEAAAKEHDSHGAPDAPKGCRKDKHGKPGGEDAGFGAPVKPKDCCKAKAEAAAKEHAGPGKGRGAKPHPGKDRLGRRDMKKRRPGFEDGFHRGPGRFRHNLPPPGPFHRPDFGRGFHRGGPPEGFGFGGSRFHEKRMKLRRRLHEGPGAFGPRGPRGFRAFRRFHAPGEDGFGPVPFGPPPPGHCPHGHCAPGSKGHGGPPPEGDCGKPKSDGPHPPPPGRPGAFGDGPGGRMLERLHGPEGERAREFLKRAFKARRGMRGEGIERRFGHGEGPGGGEFARRLREHIKEHFREGRR